MADRKPSANAKRVFWFDDGKTPNVADMLEKEPEVAMHRLRFDAPDANAHTKSHARWYAAVNKIVASRTITSDKANVRVVGPGA